jgi:phasin protein
MAYSTGQTTHQTQLAELAIRGAAAMVDFQMQAARDILEMQARNARLFGVPDLSPVFTSADDHARRVFREGAEEIVNTTRRSAEAMTEMNRQLGRLIEQQTVTIAENIQAGIGQLGRHTQQGFEQARTLMERSAEELARTLQEARGQAEKTSGQSPKSGDAGKSASTR